MPVKTSTSILLNFLMRMVLAAKRAKLAQL
jgi:hypothetical protein